MSEFTLEPLEDYPQRERVLALAAEHADAVDAGERSPFENLREIAKDGLLTLGAPGLCSRRFRLLLTLPRRMRQPGSRCGRIVLRLRSLMR